MIILTILFFFFQVDANKTPESILDDVKGLNRLVRRPRKRGGHVYLDACTFKGPVIETVITRGDGKDFYTSARKAKWGDGFVLPDNPRVVLRNYLNPDPEKRLPKE
jgi:ribosomal protein RSM22 (predicted rRNA methylase)